MPDFGLRLAERQDLSILGPLAIAIEASATVADALQCASRYMFVNSPALLIGLDKDPRAAAGVVAVTYRKDLRESTYSPQAMELGLGLFHHVALLLLGSAAGLRSVEIPHAPLSPVKRYLDFFGAEVRFGAATGALRVERTVLDKGFDTADEATSGFPRSGDLARACGRTDGRRSMVGSTSTRLTTGAGSSRGCCSRQAVTWASRRTTRRGSCRCWGRCRKTMRGHTSSVWGQLWPRHRG